MKYLNDKDFASGMMFILSGIFGLFLMADFEFGALAQPGPGFFPVVLSILLIAIGLAVAGGSFLRKSNPIPPIALRPFVLVTCAVCVFGFAIEPFGLVPSVMAATLIATYARPNFGLVHRLVISVGLATFSALLFVVGLNLPIALWSL